MSGSHSPPAQEGPPRTVKHYQYFSWPDHGVPAEPAGVLDFLDDVNQAQSSTPGAGPMVVHCRCGGAQPPGHRRRNGLGPRPRPRTSPQASCLSPQRRHRTHWHYHRD